MKKKVLHITHSWGGGIPVYVVDLHSIMRDEYDIYTLKCTGDCLVVEQPLYDESIDCYRLSEKVELLDLQSKSYREVLTRIIDAYGIELVHISITLGHTFEVFQVARDMDIPIVYTVHDYFYICPTFHLVDRCGQHCHICTHGSEDESCLKDHPYINLKSFDGAALHRWRSEFERVKSLISRFVFPSASCKDIFTSYYYIDEESCVIIPHGTNLQTHLPVSSGGNKMLRVGLLGAMIAHKGESLYKRILENADHDKVRFYHFGTGSLPDTELINIGKYERAGIIDLLRSNEIDVIMILSTWPETFSYTLSEAMVATVPCIVTNLGALAERVAQHDTGWIIDHRSPEQANELLDDLLDDRSLIDAKRQHLIDMKPDSFEAMREAYQSLYTDLTQGVVRTVAASKKADVIAELDALRVSCSKDVVKVGSTAALDLLERSIC